MEPPSRTFWLVANGHGEDAIAAALLAALRARLPDWRFVAFPVVGVGAAFEGLDVEVLGPRRRLPADGLTLHHPSLLWADLRAGLLVVTLRQLAALWAGRADAVLVVGDVYAQGLATLLRGARRYVVQPLVSVRLADGGGPVPWNRAFMERIRGPERALLRRAEAVYPRDEATAAWLRARGVNAARFLGNPMMDGLAGRPLGGGRPGATVALLPGSRAYAQRALEAMAAGLAALADAGAPCVAWVAWTLGDPPPPPVGWTSGAVGDHAGWRRGDALVGFVPHRFGDVLASADAVLGTSGTAQEQAAGLGIPVVAFPLEPAYGRPFLANQQRLLGGALQVVEPAPEAVAAGLRRALRDPEVRAAARRDGPSRLGPPGGTLAIAADIAARLIRDPSG